MIDHPPPESQALVRYTPTRFPRDARCYDCDALIPARAGCWRRVDNREDYPVVCRPERHRQAATS